MPTIRASRAHARTRAHAHEFNVPNEADDASRRPPIHPERHRPAADGKASGRRIQVRRSRRARQGRVRARSRSPRARGSSNTRARSSPGSEALRRHPHDPNDPNHTFYFHIDDKHVIDANVGGNAARWINHACKPNCEADEVDGRVFIKALRNLEPGEELFYDYGLVIDERYTAKLKKQYECRCGSKQLPRHDARARSADAATAHARADADLHWGAEALWQQLRAAAARAERRGGRAAPTRPTRRCSSARARRAAERRRSTDARRAGRGAASRARAVRPPRRRRRSPACWWPSTRPRGRGRQGRSWQSAAPARR